MKLLKAMPLALMLALTACGNDAQTPQTGDERDKQAVKYAQCMRENGVDMEDPKPGEPGRIIAKGVDRGQMEKAQEACRQYSPQQNSKPNPKANEKALEMAKCMRANGVEDFPDPKDGMMKVDKKVAEDPDFKAAQEKCGSLGGGQ